MCSTINTRRVVAGGLQTSQLPQRQPLPVGVLRNLRRARRQMSSQVPRGRPETSPEQEVVCARALREAQADLPHTQRDPPRSRVATVGPPSVKRIVDDQVVAEAARRRT